jgi:hypothetical protein
MSNLEKAMVLLDMARDHIQDAVQDTDTDGDADADLRDLIEDIGRGLLTLEKFSKWPRWDDR